MEIGLVRKVDIDREMQQSYLDYAMSVIVARALPDARDGLKPVQRRILYAMYDMGVRAGSAYKKSARIVGEVLGKYHPHGDTAVYEAMARMAQDFSLRYLLVDGQGNFGSVDGDPPAAMRYTEARLTPFAMDMLNQIDMNTVDFADNFDGTLREPLALPAAIPNLLVNGAAGIAVGMATNIPPHNLGEVVDAMVLMLNQWEKLDEITLPDLMRFIKGPDFPTGGVIIQDPQGSELAAAYGTGRGRLIVKARAHFEEMVRGRNRIIVTELPYMTNKSALIERIAELVREGGLEGVADLRDESDRQGMRIVIELTKTAEPEKVLGVLYHKTPMQSTFGINMLALVDGEPHLLTLKHALRVFIEHRLTVVHRRGEFELERARQRAHILEGLRIAFQNLDEVISLIRSSPDADTARKRLVTRFKLSEVQAQAILDMQLRRLASLERKKIEQEYKETQELIKNLETLLKSPKKMRQVVIDELQTVRQSYGDRRRTQIASVKEGASAASMLTTTDVTPAQTVWVGVTEDGKIARTHDDTPPKASGREAPYWLLKTSTHHTLYLVTDQGQAAAVPVHALPEAEKPSDGAPVHKVSPLPEGEPLAAIFSLPHKTGDQEERYLLTASRAGMIKKTPAIELPGPSAQPFTLVKINEGDGLGWVRLTDGKADLLLMTARGMSIRFNEEEVRPMGLVAAGVSGIKLGVGDELIGASTLPAAGEVMILASDGTAKRTPIAEFPLQGRYGQGVIACRLAQAVRLVGMMVGKGTLRGTVHFAQAASRFMRLDEAPQKNRTARGDLVVEVKASDHLLAITETWDAVAMWEEDKKPESSKKAAKGN
jgi:DNA gyrase subunit A